jgi:hypothetical protein
MCGLPIALKLQEIEMRPTASSFGKPPGESFLSTLKPNPSNFSADVR